MQRIRKAIYSVATIILFASLFCSCVDSRKAIYFNEVRDTLLRTSQPQITPTIAANDLLNISVSSLNPDASIIFNSPNVMMNNMPTATGTQMAGVPSYLGYLVSKEGIIKFPILGAIKVEGLTKKQIEDSITNQLISRKLLENPIVSVRLLNFRVTVVGEVNHPTTINGVNEKISIMEAIGLAGDLTLYGKRDNVLIIREKENGKEIRRVNLRSADILSSPDYFLQTNDVVYVEPIKSRVAATDRTQQLLPVIISAISLAAVIILHFL